MSDTESEFNTELFIDEIRPRSAIWDTKSEVYKDRDIKKQQWMEVAELFNPDFANKSAKEKSAVINGLQKKWKNVKDAYRKHWKSMATKSGQERRDGKKYIYAPHLTFLDSVLKLGPTEASPNVTMAVQIDVNEDNYLEEEEGNDNVRVETSYGKSSSVSTSEKRRRSRIDKKMEEYLDSFQNNKVRKITEEDDDDLFFKSMLPLIRHLPLYEKIKFRMDVMKIALEYSQKTTLQPLLVEPSTSTTQQPYLMQIPEYPTMQMQVSNNQLHLPQPVLTPQYSEVAEYLQFPAQPNITQGTSHHLQPNKNLTELKLCKNEEKTKRRSQARKKPQSPFPLTPNSQKLKPTDEVLKEVRETIHEDIGSRNNCSTPGSLSANSEAFSYSSENIFSDQDFQ